MLSNLTAPVFAVPGARHAIDSCRFDTDAGYVGVYSKKTFDQIKRDYPGATVMDALDVEQANEAYYLNQPVREISRATYDQMLDCLPPCYMSKGAGNSSFQMSELTSGRITEAFCRIGLRFFRMYCILGDSHQSIVNRAAVFIAGGKPYVVIAAPGFDREEPVAEFDTEVEALKYILNHPHDGLDIITRSGL